jgi:ketosteroid isomerase-like protein
VPVENAAAIEDVAESLFGAIENADIALIESLWAPDVAVWHSGDAHDNDRARALRVIAWFINRTVARSYDVLDRRVFDGGFVQQHILHATGTDGAVIALRVCIVIEVDDAGLITRIDEYFDPKDMAVLL